MEPSLCRLPWAAGFSHSIGPARGPAASETISGVSIEFYPQQVSDSAGDDVKSTEPLLSLTPFPDGVPKITAVLVSANNQPADQVDYHGQCKLISATANASADGHAASSVLDERNVHWWQPSEKNKKQCLTLTFAEPVDPAETPFLSMLVFLEKSIYTFRWRCVHLLGMILKASGTIWLLWLYWKTSRSGVGMTTAAINLSTVCTVIAFATNSDQQSGRAKKYSNKAVFHDEYVLQAT